MTVTCLVSITIWSAAFLPTAWTLLTVGPENVTVQANQSTFMNCSTMSGGGVKWFHNGVHVCTELQCYQHRFRVENIISTRSWNLIISSVQAEDAGDYKCEEIGFSADKRSAQLTVSEIQDKEATDGESSIGLPYATTASDTATAATTVVTTAGGTIAAIVGPILGVLVLVIIIIIIVCVVKKYQHKTQKRKKKEASYVHQPLIPVLGDEVYFDQPVLVKTIKTRITEKHVYIRAVSILKEEVFVVTNNRPEIEVYDVINLDLKHCFTIDVLINPLDIKSCVVNNCLYIFDCEYVSVPGKMLKIDCEGHVLANWPMEDSGARLSVASNGNVIVSLQFTGKGKIVEYMANGTQLTQVREIGVSSLRHAILLENANFLISQGNKGQSALHRAFILHMKDGVTKVEVVPNSELIIKASGGSNVDEMNVPCYMAVDKNGYILVAERENQRVTLLSPSLEFKKILISEKDDLRRPLNMFIDEPRGRLFVTDFIRQGTDRVDGQLRVFQIRK